LSQASKHDPDHGDRDPGLFTAGEHLIVIGKPAKGAKAKQEPAAAVVLKSGFMDQHV